jgi:tetratricopeptide (TPR) repeat protein
MEKALDHARKAVIIAKGCDALLFTTLARAFFINGEIEEAVKAGEQALKLDPENKGYKRQLDIYLEKESHSSRTDST